MKRYRKAKPDSVGSPLKTKPEEEYSIRIDVSWPFPKPRQAGFPSFLENELKKQLPFFDCIPSSLRRIISDRLPIFLNEIIGALRLYHHEVWNISQQDLDSLHLLAENIGLAMTYTRLLNAVKSIAEIVQVALPAESSYL